GGDDVWVEIRRRRPVAPSERESEPTQGRPFETRPEAPQEVTRAANDVAAAVRPAAPRPVDFPGGSALWPERTSASESAPVEPPSGRAVDERGHPARVVDPERTDARADQRPIETAQPAVVLPLTKNPLRSDSPPPLAGQA